MFDEDEAPAVLTQVNNGDLTAAKDAAGELRKMFADMPAIDRAVAKRTRQFQAIERLVTAVEAL